MAKRMHPPGFEKYPDVEAYLASDDFRAHMPSQEHAERLAEALREEAKFDALLAQRDDVIADVYNELKPPYETDEDCKADDPVAAVQAEIDVASAALAKIRHSNAASQRARREFLKPRDHRIIAAINGLHASDLRLWAFCSGSPPPCAAYLGEDARNGQGGYFEPSVLQRALRAGVSVAARISGGDDGDALLAKMRDIEARTPTRAARKKL